MEITDQYKNGNGTKGVEVGVSEKIKPKRKENALMDKYVEEDEVEEETLDLKEDKMKKKEPNLDSTHVSTSFTINTIAFTSLAPFTTPPINETSPMIATSLDGTREKR